MSFTGTCDISKTNNSYMYIYSDSSLREI